MAILCPKSNSECYGVKELTLLSDISTLLMKSRKIQDEIHPVLKRLCEETGLESAFLTLLNRNSSQIFIEVAYGLSPGQQSKGRYKIGEGIIGRVVETARPVMIPEVSKSRLFLNRTGRHIADDGRELSFICIPILIEGIVAGTLSVTRKYHETISTEEDFRLLSIIGSMIVQSISERQDQLEELENLKRENINLHQQINKGFMGPKNIIGNSGKMEDVFSLINMVAKASTTVLIRGESGCGKELVADSIHYSSNRANKPFIKVNCSALPDSLIESELFGHEKGAFTGADSMKKGRFELANGGTIFLDEIGDLPLTTQVKILRILQERELERLGGTKTIKVDLRVVCATNRNLEKAIEEGVFREDLFYRINVFPIFIPSLRERRNDIPILVDHFIEKFNKQNGTKVKRITTSAINMLLVYSWPGNIRELENVIERACLITQDNVIHSYHLPPTLQTADSSNTTATGGMMFVVENIERQLIIESLISTHGNISKSAEQLRITDRMLGTRIKKYNIEVWRYKI